MPLLRERDPSSQRVVEACWAKVARSLRLESEILTPSPRQ